MSTIAETALDTTAHQYLTFRLGEERYAFNVGRVREVLEHTRPTALPRMPDYMQGVLNVRGGVLPVIDLRTKFGMPAKDVDVNTAVVVVELEGVKGTFAIGCQTDAVEAVADISEEEIQPAPDIGTTVRSEFISGIGSIEESFVIILDPRRLFDDDELDTLSETAS